MKEMTLTTSLCFFSPSKRGRCSSSSYHLSSSHRFRGEQKTNKRTERQLETKRNPCLFRSFFIRGNCSPGMTAGWCLETDRQTAGFLSTSRKKRIDAEDK